MSYTINLLSLSLCTRVFFFNDTATTEIYTLSLHDALPISDLPRTLLDEASKHGLADFLLHRPLVVGVSGGTDSMALLDRKSTRLNSSHANISYAVFCLKKKKTIERSFSHHIM